MQLKNLSADAIEQLERDVLEDHGAGFTTPQLMEKYELNHSQVDLILYTLRATDDVVEAYMNGGATLGERTVVGRNAKHSWGFMAVLETFGTGKKVSESAVRAAFKEASATKSQGQRIGRGGRFYFGDPGAVLYEDVLKPTGTVIPADTPRTLEAATPHSHEQRFTNLPHEGQNHIGEQIHIPWAKGMSRAQWMKACIAVMTGRVPTPSKDTTPEVVLGSEGAVSKARAPRKPKAKSPATTTVVAPVEAGDESEPSNEQVEEGAA